MKLASFCGRGVLLQIEKGSTLFSNSFSATLGGSDLPISSVLVHQNGRQTLASIVFDYPTSPDGRVILSYDGRKIATGRITPNQVIGKLTRVAAGRLLGWATTLGSEGRTLALQLYADSQPIEAELTREMRPEFRYVSTASGLDGFSVALPQGFFDGKVRTLSIREMTTGHNIASLDWSFRPLCLVESLTLDNISGWCFDQSARSTALTLSLISDGATLHTAECTLRPDVATAHRCGPSGFSFSIPDNVMSFHIAAEFAPGVPIVGPYNRAVAGSRIATAWSLIRHIQATLPDMQSQKAMDILSELNWLAGLRTAESRWIPTLPKPQEGSFSEREPMVVIPVYNGYEAVKECLDSVIASTPSAVEILVIDDCSPDPRIVAYLGELHTNGTVTLLRNERNLGFPRSVNRALRQRGERDVALLNADTVVAHGWLERLVEASRSKAHVASVTPLSNNATIASYPTMNVENSLPTDVSLGELDKICATANTGIIAETPVGNGFCMLLTAAALDVVETLSEKWGRGYGEEVEWCLKTRDAGFVHLIAPNVFVAHKGSVSFGADARRRHVEKNSAIINTMYPDYEWHVRNFIRSDPLRPARINIDLKRIKNTGLPPCIHITNNFEGGTRAFVRHRINQSASREVGCILRPYEARGNGAQSADCVATLRVPMLDIRMFLTATDLANTIRDLIDNVGASIILHSTLGWNPDLIAQILSEAAFDIQVHDYAWFCPRAHVFHNGRFCGVPKLLDCVRCVEYDNRTPGESFLRNSSRTVQDYVSWHAQLLKSSNEVIAPSSATRDIMQRRFPDLKIDIRPHEDNSEFTSAHPIPPSKEVISVGFVGAVGEHKGYDVVRVFAGEVREKKLPILVNVIGYTRNDALLRKILPNIDITGPYATGQSQTLLVEKGIDVVFISSLCPETYCLTLSEAWRARVNVMAFDIGAQGERIRSQNRGLVIPLDTPWEEIPTLLLDAIRRGRFS